MLKTRVTVLVRLAVAMGRRTCQTIKLRATIPALMPLNVLQRFRWHGTPLELGELFVLHKDRREARAVLLTHQLGWEVRLLVGTQLEAVQTQVCRSQEEVFTTGEQWKAAMGEKGWD